MSKSLEELGIKYKSIPSTQIASVRTNIQKRKELHPLIDTLKDNISKENILGPAFCIFNFISSYKSGFDIEIGFPVNSNVQADDIKTRTLPEMEVLSIIHKGPVESIGESLRKLYGSTAELGLTSDEIRCEIFLDSNNPEGKEIELYFILHNWNELITKNMQRVLGEDVKQEILQGCGELSLNSSLEERFEWVKCAVSGLDQKASESQIYDILSSCAHVYPKEPIEKARAVFEKSKEETNNPLKAIDAVIEFMDKDSAWAEPPSRKGNIIYSTKLPRDPQGFKNAKNNLEKRKSYCFCPIIRNYLDQEIPRSFCYCGGGWFRRQWEGILGTPVNIEIIKTVSQGDDECTFAVHLPEL